MLRRILIPLGFFGTLIIVLMLGGSFGQTQAAVTVTGSPVEKILQTPEPKRPYPKCTEDEDCPLPTTFCGANGRCEDMQDPVCDCSQVKVLRCYEESGKARFLYCPEGCTSSGDGYTCK